jgi:REP element-mobilizing transposase RayT
MSRRQRLHVPGGTYYVVQRGSTTRPIFSQLQDYQLFERLLATALRRTGARLHAYCWTPDAIHLALQIDSVSVGRFMQGITSRYARSIHERAAESGHFFRQRYRAILIDPDAYLLKLVRYIHHIPVMDALSSDLGSYQFTSHVAYLGRAEMPWLTTRTALRRIDGCDQNSEYAEFMSATPSSEDRALFEHGSKHDARIVASTEFLENLPRHLRVYRSKLTLDQIIQTVTCRLGVDREHVLSNSRQREVTLARALIAWYATERRVATLSEVARYLRRDPSTLSVAVSRYRLCRPELFKLTALHDVVPLAQLQLQVSQPRWADEELEDAVEEELYSNGGRAAASPMRVGAGARR